MIYYITTNGVGNAWVGNELREVTRAGIPVELHSLRAPGSTFFSSADVDRLNESTRLLYPISPIDVISALVTSPLSFRGRFFAALAKMVAGKRIGIESELGDLDLSGANLCAGKRIEIEAEKVVTDALTLLKAPKIKIKERNP